MGFFDRKKKKKNNKEEEFFINTKMHNKMINKINSLYLEAPYHCYVRLIKDLDNPEELNRFKVNVNKKGFPEIIKREQTFKWEYLEAQQMFEDGDTDILKKLDNLFETNFFYKGRVAGRKGYLIKDFMINQKYINTNQKDKPTNINVNDLAREEAKDML